MTMCANGGMIPGYDEYYDNSWSLIPPDYGVTEDEYRYNNSYPYP